MSSQDKPRLLAELEALRRRVHELEVSCRGMESLESQLHQSQEELRAIYDGMVDGLLIADVETKRFRRANAAICRMLGYSEQELLSMSVMDIHPPHDLSDELTNFQAQAEGRIPINEDRAVLRKDGSIFYADIASKQVVYQGRPCLIGVFRDITERKQVQEALQASEERFRVIFEEAPVGMVLGLEDGRILRVNRAMCRISGYTPEELVGRYVRDFVHPEDQGLGQPMIKDLLAGKVPSYSVERRYLGGAGRTFWSRTTVAAIHAPDGKFAFALGIVEDITERKMSEVSMRQNHEQLQTIYEGMVEGLLITDIETTRFHRVNSSLCRMLGYTEAELLALSLQDLHPPEEASGDMQRFHAVAEGRYSINENRPVLRKDGSVFYADITGHKILYNGRPCLLALFRDVTERREAQESLQREQRTLRRLLQSSDHERQLIAYEIHDGLAQQLAAAIMQFQAYEHLNESPQANAKRAYEAGLQMLRQAHGESRRLISGVRPPVLDESGIATALAHLVYDQGEHCPQIDFQSRVTFSRLAPILENAIYRIAQEALTNARKHSRSDKVRVSLVQDNDLVSLEVQDWGIGFDMQAIGEDRFGLEGIKERVRLLDGQLSLVSRPGEGTCIRVTLPVLEQN